MIESFNTNSLCNSVPVHLSSQVLKDTPPPTLTMVYISQPDGKTLSLDVNPTTTTLHALKLSIHQKTLIPKSYQRLIITSKPKLLHPNDDFTLLTQLGIHQNSTLTLHIPLCGGTQPPPTSIPPTRSPLDSLNSEPPPNYVAGLGRGATGFTTRSDIGPARAAADLPDRFATTIENQKFDEFEGNGVGLFASAGYNEDDTLRQAVDKRMDTTREDRREATLKREIEKYRASNPKMMDQIADSERKSHTLSAQEWESIPEIGDHSLPNKRKRSESFGTVPNTLVEKEQEHVTTAKKKEPQNPELWLAAVIAESKHGNKKEADVLLAKALQECPRSGILLAASMEMGPIPQRKSKASKALRVCDRDPHVFAAVAEIYRDERKVDKARTWFHRAVTLAPDIGDFWALFYKFELEHGTEDEQKEVLKRCVAAEPKNGRKWQAIARAEDNHYQLTEAILKKLVAALGKEESAAGK